MITNQTVAPTSEPVTRAMLKDHLKIDTGDMADSITPEQSIVPGSHAVTAGFTLFGSAVTMTADSALVMVDSGANGVGGTVDIKIQESDTGVGGWSDWADGAFDVINEANDNQIHEKEYTGGKDYIRLAGQVLTAACEFGGSIIQYTPTSDEDDLLDRINAGARRRVEGITGRQLESATWDYIIQDWPDGDAIKLPYGNLTSVTSIIWKDSDGDETTLTVTTDYLVETNGEQCGRIVLPYSGSWPSGTLYPSNPITIKYVCGYTTVPDDLKTVILLVAEDAYKRGEDGKQLKAVIDFYTCDYRLHDEFN